jgi:hypothetical protein
MTIQQLGTINNRGTLLPYIRVIPRNQFSHFSRDGRGVVIYFENEDDRNKAFSYGSALFPDSSNEIIRAYNDTGSVITCGSAVYHLGFNETMGMPNIALASAASASTSVVIGLAAIDIADGSAGPVVIRGDFSGIDTSSLTLNQIMLLSNTPGAFDDTGGTTSVNVCKVTAVSGTEGTVYVFGCAAGPSNGGGGGGGGVTVEDDMTTVSGATNLTFPDGSVTNNGGGSATVGTGVTATDGSTTVDNATDINFQAGTLVDNGSGSVTYAPEKASSRSIIETVAGDVGVELRTIETTFMLGSGSGPQDSGLRVPYGATIKSMIVRAETNIDIAAAGGASLTGSIARGGGGSYVNLVSGPNADPIPLGRLAKWIEHSIITVTAPVIINDSADLAGGAVVTAGANNFGVSLIGSEPNPMVRVIVIFEVPVTTL